MEFKNYEMSNCLGYLQEIAPKVTGKLAYAISRNIRKISDECVEFEKIRIELIQKYGEEDGDGNISVKKSSDNYNKFLEELEVYSNISHDVDIYKIDASDLFDSELNANDMLFLEFMINEETTAE